MKLAEWLVTKGIRQAELSRMLDVTQPTVHNWVNRKAPPSARQMMRLYQMSGGKVNLKDWCEEFEVK
jgi:predicted transcriptional regulator